MSKQWIFIGGNWFDNVILIWMNLIFVLNFANSTV